MKLFLFLAVCLLSQSIAYAQAANPEQEAPLCLNDKDGKKGASSQIINKMIAEANDPLAEAFKTYQAVLCQDAIDSTPPTSLRYFLKAAKLNEAVIGDLSESTPTFIKKQCIEASLQRDINQKAYACNQKKQAKEFENSGKGVTPCLNKESVDYIHYSVNLAIKCFASIRTPIDPRFLLKKVNTETGFNFFLASEGGTGLGQITSYPVKDLAGKKEGEGNARPILEDLLASPDPACEPFKRVLKKDLTTPPPTPPIDNVCTYVAANDGFARTLVMGIGYYIYTRDESVIPFLKTKMGSAAENRELINYATLLSYGPKGPNGAKAFMDGFNKKTNVAKAIQKLKTAKYVSDAEKRFTKELLPSLKPDTKDFTDNEKRGDTCVGR